MRSCYGIPGQSVAVTTATVIGARHVSLRGYQRPTPPAGTNDNDSFDMAADPALGRGDFGDFAIQHSWTCMAMPFGFSIGECLDNERPNCLCCLTQMNPCR